MTSATIAESITVNSASAANSRKMISTPKNTPVMGALKVAEMPPAAPQATMIRSRLSGIRTHHEREQEQAAPPGPDPRRRPRHGRPKPPSRLLLHIDQYLYLTIVVTY